MKALFDTPMPPRIHALPKDERGFPIPWNVLRDKNGKALFTVNDGAKHLHALTGGLCPICGDPLGEDRWFVGGPASAFHPNGWYRDLPGHCECVEFALAVCPYLAAKNYKAVSKDFSEVLPEGVVTRDYTQDPNRPLVFVMVRFESMEVKARNADDVFVRPRRPYLEVRYWSKGVRLSEEEGTRLANESMHR